MEQKKTILNKMVTGLPFMVPPPRARQEDAPQNGSYRPAKLNQL
ncbi:MAG: hypothetical protein ACK2UR_17210 [Candidatus Promineifilaceae bacterium]